MKQYDNTNRGVLFKNNRKAKDSQPDYTGKINVDGVDKEISAWIKSGAKGDFLSLSVKEPYQKPDQSQPVRHEFDDELPPF